MSDTEVYVAVRTANQYLIFNSEDPDAQSPPEPEVGHLLAAVVPRLQRTGYRN
jgi:hypothetical protein